jgi:hypothetical protein
MRNINVFALCLSLFSLPANVCFADFPVNSTVVSQFKSTPLAFTQNQGQWPDNVLYRASAGGATMWFTNSGVVYQLTKRIPRGELKPGEAPRPGVLYEKVGRIIDSIECTMIKAEFVGANLNVCADGLKQTEYKCNYFLGDDPAKWRTDVPNFESIQYREIYAGIDLKYYGNGKQMEYDFIVSPGADYSQIQIRYDGAKSLAIGNNDELRIKTEYGEIIEQPLFVYQDIDGEKKPINGQYFIIGNNTFGFAIDSYDPQLALVIDPILKYSTYLGGSNIEENYGIAVNAAGEAIVAGYTLSANFPLVNAYQSTIINFDIFVTKFNSSGSSPIFSTYLGGNGQDLGNGVALGKSGSIYVAGASLSTDFPTVNQYQLDQGGEDVTVTKMSSAGNSLIYSTYIGGSADESATAIAIDTAGAAYLTGYTTSSNYSTVNPYQTDQIDYDVIVTKVSSSGSSLVYSTYLGHSGLDFANDITVDESGSAYVVGNTTSTSFPTLNPYQTDQASLDGFVTKFSPAGATLEYSTYLGGNGLEQCWGIDVDTGGAAYITGYTSSTNFPTLTPYQTDQAGFDAFVTKLSNTGSNIFYSTYLGGDSSDYGRAIKVDSYGNAIIAGHSSSSTFPLLHSHQGHDSRDDAFVAKLDAAGTSLIFSTYLGGDSTDGAWALALDPMGAAYVTGTTQSPNFPTLNPYQTDQGVHDVFVAKVQWCCIGIRGDCNYDGTDANILDLTFLVDRIFRGGPPAPCPEEADINSDGTTSNILDLTYLVDRIFRGGPAPGTC